MTPPEAFVMATCLGILFGALIGAAAVAWAERGGHR